MYFPLKDNELPNENIGAFLHIVDVLLQEKSLKPRFLSSIKIFRSFVSTLPTSKGYLAGLASISQLYRDMKDSEKHNDSVLAHYDRLEVDLLAFEIDYDAVMKYDFLESWQRVSKFIETLLSFSRSYPVFFLNKLSIIEGESELSLRSIHGQLNEMINNINDTSDFHGIQDLISAFRQKCLVQVSVLSKIFTEISTTNAIERIIKFFKSDENVFDNLEINGIFNDVLTLDIPYFILSEIIFKEVITNLRHRDTQIAINLNFARDEGKVKIKIVNGLINPTISSGGGYGLLLLNKLNEFPNGIISYTGSNKLEINSFVQEINIKIA